MASPARSILRLSLTLLATASSPVGAQASAPPPPPQLPASWDESARDALDEARSAQARFERERRQWSPIRSAPWSGSECDERIGRICLRYDEGGDWWPTPEDPRIVQARLALLSTLGSAARVAADPWTRGQRIFYLAESGRWTEAEALARGCVAEDAGGCGALLGFALHGQRRFTEAEAAFREAIARMDASERRRWTDPSVLLDGDGARSLRSAGAEGTAARAAAEGRLWRLADPLYLVDGNDRLTEHWSRITVAGLHEGAQNPYQMSWGRDLEEVLVRFGWEVGWDRTRDPGGGATGVVGHHHPEIRSYLPPGTVLADPTALAAAQWTLSPPRPREGYAPPYAPVILPAERELLRFPRGDRSVVVALFAMPVDTSHHARHGHPPFKPGDGAPGATVAGLFLMPMDAGSLLEAHSSGAEEGVLVLDAPAGEYFAGVEVWDPARGFAGRRREALRIPRAPDGSLAISDLMFLQGALSDSAALADALGVARLRGSSGAGERVVVGWEIQGARGDRALLSYRLSLVKTDRALIERVGDWLGISRPGEGLQLAWEEPAPGGAGLAFRSLTLEIPELGAGDYLLRVEVGPSGAPPVGSERILHIERR